MKPSETIIVRLELVEQLLEPCPPSPFRQRRLREEAEQFLVERVTALPRKLVEQRRLVWGRANLDDTIAKFIQET